MTRQKLPKTDSIEELARFWDTHDLTDFEQELEEVREPVFARSKGVSLSIDLQPAAAKHLKEIAQSKGLKETSVVRQWILERLEQLQGAGQPPNKALQPPAQKPRRGRTPRSLESD
ncbi:MAG: hypothetical protein FJW20_16225 [Acidimicrobiia bacterium]|nr:hypothetical protein [Acidimicrobiia bacterium]